MRESLLQVHRRLSRADVVSQLRDGILARSRVVTCGRADRAAGALQLHVHVWCPALLVVRCIRVQFEYWSIHVS